MVGRGRIFTKGLWSIIEGYGRALYQLLQWLICTIINTFLKLSSVFFVIVFCSWRKKTEENMESLNFLISQWLHTFSGLYLAFASFPNNLQELFAGVQLHLPYVSYCLCLNTPCRHLPFLRFQVNWLPFNLSFQWFQENSWFFKKSLM